MFKYPKTFQCDNGSEFKNEVTKLLEKHNVDIRRAAMKYRHTHTAFVETFNRELAKLLFKPMDAQELQDPEKVSTIWVKNLNRTVNKMSNTESNHQTKLIQKKPCYPKKDCIDIFISLANNMETKKDGQQTI